MPPLTCHDLVLATGGHLAEAAETTVCTRISTDSRDIQPGDVFWALKGSHFDGHDFAATARQHGAQLIVCAAEREHEVAAPRLVVSNPLAALADLARWHRRRLETLIIGVTGSVGKTTTKELIYTALAPQFQGVRSPGNYNNEIGLPKSLLAIEPQHEFAVLEFGASRPGDIQRLAGIAQPEIGVITAIGKSHLESFGSVAALARTKGELFAALPSSGIAVLPGNTPFAESLAARAACRVVTVGADADCAVRASQVRSDAHGLQFGVDGCEFFVPRAPDHFLNNALIAIAIGREIGVPLDVLSTALRRFEPVSGRFQRHEWGGVCVIDDTYNASPTSVATACEWLRITRLTGRRYLALGDMLELGSACSNEHFEAGRHAAQAGVDGLLAFGASAGDVARGAAQCGLRPGRIVATCELEVLLAVLDCWLEPGDIVLVKGSRAMQMERVVMALEQRLSLGDTRRQCA